jgi:O-antigen/teichoic acid export membrane protein
MNLAWIRRLPKSLQKKIEGRYTIQRLVENLSWLFIDRMIRLIGGLVVGVWIARYLGPTDFGLLSYAIALVSMFSTFATLGLDSIVVRNLVRHPGETDKILGTTFALRVLSGSVAFFLIIGTTLVLSPKDVLTQWLVGITSAGMIFQAFDTIDLWFQAQVQSKYTVYAKSIAFIITTGIKIILIIQKAPLIAFACIGLIEILIASMALIVFYQLTIREKIAWKIDFSQIKTLLSYGIPTILTGTAVLIQGRIDQVMLKEMISDAEVAQYSIAMRLIETFAFIPMIIYSSVGPDIAQSKLEEEHIYHQKLLNLYRLMMLLFLMIAIPLVVFGYPIVTLLYGQKYQMAGFLLPLFAIRLFFANFGVIRSLYITNENLFNYALITACTGSLSNIIINYLLIPSYASKGAIIATIISLLISTFWMDSLFSKTKPNFELMQKGMLTPLSFFKSVKS